MKEDERIGELEVKEGGRVLVVGDDRSNHLTSRLHRVGLSVAIAANGLEALVNAFQSVQRGNTYDLVLINMPTLNLDKTSLAIRKLKEYRNVPILVLATDSDAQGLSANLPGAINEVLTFPLDAAATLDRLKYWLGPGKEDAAKGMEGLQFEGAEMLPGIDLQTGLSHLAGNWKLYRDLLLKFSDSHARFGDQLVEKLDRGELSDAGRMIHTLKGLSGSLGMNRLRLLSQQLEGIIRHGVAGESRALVQPLSNELTNVLASIRTKIRAGDSTKTAQPLQWSIAKLLELESTLNDHNPEATQQIDEIGDIKGYESEMARLKKAVAAYEFDTALAVLRRIKSSTDVSSFYRVD